jgi:hypothetical protein
LCWYKSGHSDGVGSDFVIGFGCPPSNDLPLAQLGNVVLSEAEHIHQYVLGMLAEFGGPVMAQVHIANP